jgi:hypothetical protein
MTRTAIQVLFAAALCLAGCGHKTADLSGETGNTGSAGTGNAGPIFSLRLAGTDMGDFESAHMRIKSVEVRSGATVLESKVRTPEVDLAAAGQAYLITSFQVPAGVEDVEFLVGFDGGTLGKAGRTIVVGSRCQTLRLAGKVNKIAQRNHAVITVDVARSFVPSGTGMTLVPHFQLVY